MPRVNIANFQQIESSPKPIPAGKYNAQIFGAELTASKDPEKESFWNWEFVTLDAGVHSGRHLFKNTFTSPKAAFTTKAITDACGVKGDAAGFMTEDCIGKKVLLVVSVEDYKGNPVNRVDRVLSPQI